MRKALILAVMLVLSVSIAAIAKDKRSEHLKQYEYYLKRGAKHLKFKAPWTIVTQPDRIIPSSGIPSSTWTYVSAEGMRMFGAAHVWLDTAPDWQIELLAYHEVCHATGIQGESEADQCSVDAIKWLNPELGARLRKIKDRE